MEKIIDLKQVRKGDLFYYEGSLSIIEAINYRKDNVIFELDPDTIVEINKKSVFEVFRLD